MALEPIQRRIRGPQEHAPSASALDLARDFDAIGRLTNAQRGQQQHQLEIGQHLTGHLFTYYERCCLDVNGQTSGRWIECHWTSM